MNSLISRSLLIMSLFAATACGDDPADVVRDGLAQFDRIAAETCRCAPTLSMGALTEEQCLADFRENLATESETQCLEGVYEGASDADISAAECQRDAFAAWADCSEDAECTNEAFAACQAAHEAAEARCPELSAELESMSDACFPE